MPCDKTCVLRLMRCQAATCISQHAAILLILCSQESTSQESCSRMHCDRERQRDYHACCDASYTVYVICGV